MKSVMVCNPSQNGCHDSAERKPKPQGDPRGQPDIVREIVLAQHDQRRRGHGECHSQGDQQHKGLHRAAGTSKERKQDHQESEADQRHSAIAETITHSSTQEVSRDGGCHEDRQGRPGSRLGLVEDVDPEEGNKGVQTVEDHRTGEQRCGKEGKGHPLGVLRLRHLEAWLDWALGLIECRTPGEAEDHEPGHKSRGHEQGYAAMEPPEEHGGRGQERADRETELAADGEEAHGCGLPVSGQIVDETSPFRMECRHAQTAQGNHQDSQLKTGDHAGQGNTGSGTKHGDGYQPGSGAAIGNIAQHRLGKRRSKVDCKHDGCGSRVADVVFRNKEGEQNGDCALIDVGCRVGEYQKANGLESHKKEDRNGFWGQP